MLTNCRNFARFIKYLLYVVFCVSWIACVNEWQAGARWRSRREVHPGLSTMRTIVGYSEGKQAEMDRPTPVTCDIWPNFPRINYHERTWPQQNNATQAQDWQRVDGTRVSLYAAFYDERSPQRYVRILAMFHGRNFTTEDTLFCQTRSLNPSEESVEVVAAKPLEIWWQAWDIKQAQVDTPLLLSCPLQGPLFSPSIVSVVTQPCNDPTNAFQLEPQQNLQKQRLFTICVKDLFFNEDISQKLVEWIETNKILGVDLIDIYVDKITKATENVLLYYRDQGFVRLFQVPIKYSSEKPLWQKRRDHIITYNDCLYRNIKESIFIVPLDVDEIILPKISNTWPELLERLSTYGWDSSKESSILIRNVFFFDYMQRVYYKNYGLTGGKNIIYIKRDDVRIDSKNNLDISEVQLIDYSNNIEKEVIDVENTVDKELYNNYKDRCGDELPTPKLVKHIVRSAIVSPFGYYSKSWMLTKKVLTAFNHYPLSSLGASSSIGWTAPFKEVQLNHYKESCNTTVVVECARYERRARIDRTAQRLRSNLTKALATTICTGIHTL